MLNNHMEAPAIKMLDYLTEKSPKKAPYPLDSLGEDLSEFAFQLMGIQEKMNLAIRNAVITKNEKKKAIADKMIFKLKTIVNITNAFIKDYDRLKF